MDKYIGLKFSRLTVLKQEGLYNNKRKTYLCECVCGNTTKTAICHLKSGAVKSCGCLLKEQSRENGQLRKKCLLNKRFGNLIVISEKEHTPRGIVWFCKCDCGGEKNVLGVNLRKNNGTRSCGCIAKSNLLLRNKQALSKTPWLMEMNIYKKQASKRNLSFDLIVDDFVKLITSVCDYCGAEPSKQMRSVELRKKKILKLGIDRIDSNVGYTSSNCVSCCSSCNYAKGNKDVVEFLQETQKRYEFLLSNKRIVSSR